ncbi:shikimate kinase [Mucisphaera sp.]|uniref:shikimate kinase n=1 Tax=Mucisphaera sp. TaxID=2913024 RepID=UPI003D0C9AA2
MKIVLIGYRGSGKSTVAAALAQQLGLSLIDTDTLVRACFNHAEVSEIFEEYGEARFRQVETEIALKALQGNDFVAAFGGGTPIQPAVTQALTDWADGTCVYLAAPAELLAERIATDTGPGADRPSLTGSWSAAEEVHQLLAEREPTYQRVADLTIQTEHLTPAQIVEAIIASVHA